MTLPSTRLDVVLAGDVALLSDGKTPSAMGKRPVDGPVAVGPVGLTVDRQADLTVHGGADKAILHYAFDHYPAWRADLPAPASARLDRPGAFGENLSSTGVTEADICIGDVVRVGEVLLQVTQGRQPCFKLDLFHGHEGMAAAVRTTGRTGWYYRVLQEGRLGAGDGIAVVERPHPAWTVRRAHTLLWDKSADPALLAEIAALPPLAEAWRKSFEKRIAVRATPESSA